MSDISLVVAVTRTELALADLAIDPINGYDIVNLGPGARSWRRETVKNSYVHGETLVAAVMDVQIVPLTVRVRGANKAQLNTRLDTLFEAFSQFVYFLGVIMDGEAWIWECQPADASVGEGGAFNKFHWMAGMVEVTFSIPRDPVPTIGTL